MYNKWDLIVKCYQIIFYSDFQFDLTLKITVTRYMENAKQAVKDVKVLKIYK